MSLPHLTNLVSGLVNSNPIIVYYTGRKILRLYPNIQMIIYDLTTRIDYILGSELAYPDYLILDPISKINIGKEIISLLIEYLHLIKSENLIELRNLMQKSNNNLQEQLTRNPRELTPVQKVEHLINTNNMMVTSLNSDSDTDTMDTNINPEPIILIEPDYSPDICTTNCIIL